MVRRCLWQWVCGGQIRRVESADDLEAAVEKILQDAWVAKAFDKVTQLHLKNQILKLIAAHRKAERAVRAELRWEGDYVYGTHIKFVNKGKSASGKTLRWEIIGEDEESLGWVKWYGPWRTYAFDAEPETVYEKTCLRQIAQFCEELTKEHRERRKADSQPKQEQSRA